MPGKSSSKRSENPKSSNSSNSDPCPLNQEPHTHFFHFLTFSLRTYFLKILILADLTQLKKSKIKKSKIKQNQENQHSPHNPQFRSHSVLGQQISLLHLEFPQYNSTSASSILSQFACVCACVWKSKHRYPRFPPSRLPIFANKPPRRSSICSEQAQLWISPTSSIHSLKVLTTINKQEVDTHRKVV